MTEGTSQQDQARRLEREFKRGEIIAKLFSDLVTSSSSPWRRLEAAYCLQDWFEEWGSLFPSDPLTHLSIEAERQRALGEIVSPMWELPAPSFNPLSTEGQRYASAPGYIPDRSSSLLPISDPVPDPVREGSVDEPPSQVVPAREGFGDRLPPLLVSVSEEFESELPPLPNPVPVPAPFLEGSEDELPPSLVPVTEEFVDELSPLPVPVLEEVEDELPRLPFPVHEGCEDALSQSAATLLASRSAGCSPNS
ncbi:hypothetical protein CRENBAI_006366 [Crenichthys baileyi]|uniref:Uncharacterized protein n=1 Tax=Crenichthys baileyi TaxID=28760 RepID=A0AAV9S8J5_9TELE